MVWKKLSFIQKNQLEALFQLAPNNPGKDAKTKDTKTKILISIGGWLREIGSNYLHWPHLGFLIAGIKQTHRLQLTFSSVTQKFLDQLRYIHHQPHQTQNQFHILVTPPITIPYNQINLPVVY